MIPSFLPSRMVDLQATGGGIGSRNRGLLVPEKKNYVFISRSRGDSWPNTNRSLLNQKTMNPPFLEYYESPSLPLDYQDVIP